MLVRNIEKSPSNELIATVRQGTDFATHSGFVSEQEASNWANRMAKRIQSGQRKLHEQFDYHRNWSLSERRNLDS